MVYIRIMYVEISLCHVLFLSEFWCGRREESFGMREDLNQRKSSSALFVVNFAVV